MQGFSKFLFLTKVIEEQALYALVPVHVVPRPTELLLLNAPNFQMSRVSK